MKHILRTSLILIIWFLFTGCSEESQIEGLVFSDKIKVEEVNKEIVIVPNYYNQTQNIKLNINDKSYDCSIIYTQFKNNNTITQYSVSIQIGDLIRMMKTNGNAAYNLEDGEEIRPNSGYFSGYFPLLQTTGNNNNQAANTIKLDESFNLGFNVGGNTEYASYGWLKMNISNNKITIISYAYRTAKSIKAGEQ